MVLEHRDEISTEEDGGQLPRLELEGRIAGYSIDQTPDSASNAIRNSGLDFLFDGGWLATNRRSSEIEKVQQV